MSAKGVLAIDQGSGSTKALVLDESGNIIASASAAVETIFPQPGWVQQNPEKIWESVTIATRGAISQVQDVTIVAVGLSTQRESLVVWNRNTGKAIHPVLTWQDRSSAPLVSRYIAYETKIRDISGLPLDPMFSALKAVRILSETASDLSEICIGTIDSWLLFKLGAGHVIESGNASRTQLLDVTTGKWSPDLLSIFAIDQRVLPKIVDSNARHAIAPNVLTGIAKGTPVTGVLGDSHAALFAHAGWLEGRVKATYGTGSSIMTIGNTSTVSSGLCNTIAWSLNGKISQALEANILSSGSTLVWLSELFGESVDELMLNADKAKEVIEIVPAFNGLAAPWWDEKARGTMTGLTLGTSKADIASAGLDSIAMQVADVLDEIRLSGLKIFILRADGGATSNSTLLQRQADFSDIQVDISSTKELSAVGAGNLAGLTVGLWSVSDLESRATTSATFMPAINREIRLARRTGWQNAVARARMKP